jgi:uncharacterized protein (DUF1684 family)
MTGSEGPYLELLDWRRRVAEMWATWRRDAALDPTAATVHFREAKDELFATHPQSPLPTQDRASFSGLAYWPYDPAYRLAARLEPESDDLGPHESRDDAASGLELPSSGPGAIRFRRIGWLSPGGPLAGQRLPAFWIEGYAGGLFVPFRDSTSGQETYGAGRYLLDTMKSADHGLAEPGLLCLDFNLAFHPSCAYDARWSCPLAPRESWLGVPIPVGERSATR